MKRMFLFVLVSAILSGLFLVAKSSIASSGDRMSLEEFIGLKDNDSIVILNAYDIEPLLHVSRFNEYPKTSDGVSQEWLDKTLKNLIPNKDTPVILFCKETFYQTRKMPATSFVSMFLEANGYSNVREMEKLWLSETTDASINDSNIKMYEDIFLKKAKKLPEDAQNYIKKASDKMYNKSVEGKK